ncbi:MFS transporter [Herbaspirillum rubrisubalbicans]|uniref:MFS transporter n=1 Tax=Herbaspirillum rubrisubalbicans TaxID=80842 RepID=UPI0034503620
MSNSAQHPSNHPRFLLFLICAFASAGQLAIDLYVPALPKMAIDYGTSAQAIQISVTAYLIAYAFGQLVFGPLADAYGRKRVLMLGLGLFTLGCVLSLAAPNLETFVAARVLQGFGIAATNLLAKAIITDSFSGQTLIHAYTYMATAWGLAPIVAPVIGAHLQEAFGWRSCLIPVGLFLGDVGHPVALPRNPGPAGPPASGHAVQECPLGAGQPGVPELLPGAGPVLQHPAGVQHRRPLHGAKHPAAATDLLRLPGPGHWHDVFPGRHFQSPAPPSPAQRRAASAHRRAGHDAGRFRDAGIGAGPGLASVDLDRAGAGDGFLRRRDVSDADGQGQFHLPAHRRPDQRHPGFCAAAGVVGHDGAGRFRVHP